MSKLKILAKALVVSIKIKGAFSIFISLLGFPAALLPVLLAMRLRDLTDELQFLAGFVGEGGEGNAAAAFAVFGGIVGLYVAQMLITAISKYVSKIDEEKTRTYIRRTILRHKCEVRYKYIENFDDFQKRISFAEEYAGNTMAESMGRVVSISQLMVTFVAASIALWEISWVIVVVLYVTSLPAAILSYLQQDETFRVRSKWMEESRLAILYYNLLAGGTWMFTAIQEIRHGGLFDYLKARWRAIVDEYLSKKNKLMKKHVAYNTSADFLRSVVYIGILMITAWQIYQNPVIGLGAFTLVYALSGQLQTVTANTFVGVMVLAQDIPYMKEFFYLEELEREPSINAEELPSGEITLEGVDFSYPDSEDFALKDITIQIKDGEKIAIVGENGSGKSTLISLLCGMHEPKRGKIKITRSAVSVVFQDFAQYEATLRENITVSDKTRKATDAEIMKMLEKINVNDVVNLSQNGLDEEVGAFSNSANNLSGGQWQKISLARAAYKKDAKIMILDEPTSALDPIAEAQLYKNFADLTHDKTTILISHRLGITAVVDRILVLKKGQLIEDGTHHELMTKNGHYAEMYNAQAQWYAEK
ncbi:MAG: ABC transporter ATP-binding protein/permease [Defluviitaleaceae bacterium]|nr:ABC transporter ATP-binding protein/permease [Defluviitaleaceae bacterium]